MALTSGTNVDGAGGDPAGVHAALQRSALSFGIWFVGLLGVMALQRSGDGPLLGIMHLLACLMNMVFGCLFVGALGAAMRRRRSLDGRQPPA